MREGLIAAPVLDSSSRRFGHIRGGNELALVSACSAFSLVFFFIVWGFFVQSLGPNDYGLKRNKISGTIDANNVQRGGLHLLGPYKEFMVYPATQITLEFSKHSLYRRGYGPIAARSGSDRDSGDEAGGGQPITISCAFQYKFRPQDLAEIYLSFGSSEAATQRFYQLSKMAISSTAQRFTPQDFWQDRETIADAMLKSINKTLVQDGHVEAVRFQIMKVEFQPVYEDSITSIQIAEQQRVINEADQKVKEVEQSIKVMEAENAAAIVNISAGADADAKYKVAEAKKDAFVLTQESKAKNYGHLQSQLGLTGPTLTEYFKIKAVQAKGKVGSKIVVGMSNPGFQSATASEL